MISVQTEDFHVEAEYAALRHRAGDAGAIVLFTGLVRELYGTESNDSEGSGKTQRLFLEHYPGMTENSWGRSCNKRRNGGRCWACASSTG